MPPFFVSIGTGGSLSAIIMPLRELFNEHFWASKLVKLNFGKRGRAPDRRPANFLPVKSSFFHLCSLSRIISFHIFPLDHYSECYWISFIIINVIKQSSTMQEGGLAVLSLFRTLRPFTVLDNRWRRKSRFLCDFSKLPPAAKHFLVWEHAFIS